MSFEIYLLPDDDLGQVKMPINTLQSIFTQYITGDLSGGEAKTIIEAYLTSEKGSTVTLTSDEQTDLVDTIGYITDPTKLEDKLARMHRIFSIFEMAEIGEGQDSTVVTLLNATQALLRAKMQTIVTTWTTPS